MLCWLKINWDWKSIVTESKACDWKTMEIEIKQVIEKQLRCFIILIEFNADNKQCWVKNCWDEKKMRLKNTWFCWLKLMLSENNRDAKECWLILMLMLDFVDGVHTVLFFLQARFFYGNSCFFHFLPHFCHIWWFFNRNCIFYHFWYYPLWKIIKYGKNLGENEKNQRWLTKVQHWLTNVGKPRFNLG